MRRLVGVLLACSVTAVPLACGGNDDELGGGGGSDDASLASMLGLVADDPDMRSLVVYGNLARVREAAGIETPTASLEDYVGSLMDAAGAGWRVPRPFDQQTADEALVDEVGFDLRNIDASIEAGQPPDQIAIYTGRIDAEQVDSALTSFEPYADDVEVGEREGVTTYRFGAEGEISVEGVTPARPLGESLRLGVDGSTVWWTRSDQSLDTAVDVARSDEQSLADVEGFASIGEALDATSAYAAVVTGDAGAFNGIDPSVIMGTDRLTPEQIEEIKERLGGGGGGLVRWSVAGLGETLIDGEPGFAIALAHDDEERAEENVERLEAVLRDGESLVSSRPWSDYCLDPDVSRDGTVALATCRSEVAGRSFPILQARDSLLMWN